MYVHYDINLYCIFLLLSKILRITNKEFPNNFSACLATKYFLLVHTKGPGGYLTNYTIDTSVFFINVCKNFM